jgi:DNA repair protein RAD5
MLDSDGNKIVELPPKEVRMLFTIPHTFINSCQVTVEQLEFSPLERKIYDSIFTDAKRDFERLAAKGLVNRNYTHILAMLMRYVSHVGTLTFKADSSATRQTSARRTPSQPSPLF